MGASLDAITALSFCISTLYDVNMPDSADMSLCISDVNMSDSADMKEVLLPGLHTLHRAALLACSAFDLVVASRFERLLNS